MAIVSIKGLLARHNLATPQQFDEWHKAWRVTQEAGSADTFMMFVARERGASEETFLRELAAALDWPYIDLTKTDVSADARKKISTKIAFQYSVLPVKFEEGRLTVAVSNPFDAAMLSAVQFDARVPVQYALTTHIEIDKSLKKFYGVGAETLDEMAKDDEPWICWEDKEITEGDQEASVIKFVNQIIWEAFKDRATDIHFEPAEDELRIRYRIDGILHQTPMPPQLKRFQASLISRIKVMSGMNIAEKRLPQDGRINVRIKGEEIDIRVSTVPTVYGESVSLRLLTRGKIFLGMEKLGFAPAEESRIREIIVKPHGIFLVTGPTGSGKSTSLYAFLATINSVTKRIITIEEPVEYELKGINQIAVRGDIGLTFAMGLRHILRQDPNVIMVGEIRDLETAEIAIRAALTGHLVFSTLHTNDAPSAFTRLIDMGIEPFLVASSVEAVLAQRLVRTICPKCKAEQKVGGIICGASGFPRIKSTRPASAKGPGARSAGNWATRGAWAFTNCCSWTRTSARSSWAAPPPPPSRKRPCKTACALCGPMAGTRSGPPRPPSRKSCASRKPKNISIADRRRQTARLGERFLMARWHSANVLQTNAGGTAPLAACRQRRTFYRSGRNDAADQRAVPAGGGGQGLANAFPRQTQHRLAPAGQGFLSRRAIAQQRSGRSGVHGRAAIGKTFPAAGHACGLEHLFAAAAGRQTRRAASCHCHHCGKERGGRISRCSWKRKGFWPTAWKRPVWSSLLAAKINEDGVWIFAGAAGEPALVVWCVWG